MYLKFILWNNTITKLQQQNLGATQTDTEIKDKRGWERDVSVFVCVAVIL